MSWTPQVGDVNIKTSEMYFATGAAGSGGALAGSKAVGTKVEADTPLAPAASGAPPPTTTSLLLAALGSRCEGAGRQRAGRHHRAEDHGRGQRGPVPGLSLAALDGCSEGAGRQRAGHRRHAEGLG